MTLAAHFIVRLNYPTLMLIVKIKTEVDQCQVAPKRVQCAVSRCGPTSQMVQGHELILVLGDCDFHRVERLEGVCFQNVLWGAVDGEGAVF
ncbi:hypothetical protein SAMN04488518_1136 [Pseudovibrio ascidiaceicola]|uniref:Uncharacterized protein n=1 Tax=Pseudovibrio ascidiaceicola TaxID=285279 RepID=A0A1I4DZB3_9HYPH|nr:hypothetical protein SAMN04488518_1136 [Pseudovibrio ascidiaceicola]